MAEHLHEITDLDRADEIDRTTIFVVWNSKAKRINMCTFNEDLANQVTEHYIEGLQKSSIPVYQDLEEYLDDASDDIAEEARKRLTPLEYEALKRTIEEEYPQYSEFSHEARTLYD